MDFFIKVYKNNFIKRIKLNTIKKKNFFKNEFKQFTKIK